MSKVQNVFLIGAKSLGAYIFCGFDGLYGFLMVVLLLLSFKAV